MTKGNGLLKPFPLPVKSKQMELMLSIDLWLV